MDAVPTPETLHCAPLGWPGIRHAMAVIANWFDRADPALMICDVSARDRAAGADLLGPACEDSPAWRPKRRRARAAYDGAGRAARRVRRGAGPARMGRRMRAKTCFVGGLGVDTRIPERELARPADRSGRRGNDPGPVGRRRRRFCRRRWASVRAAAPAPLRITIGPVARDWHATEPANIEHRGWVDNPADHVAAADLVIASTGNTTCQQILAAARPWLAIPEWRYFDEQHRKAEACGRRGGRLCPPHLPSSAQAWTAALAETRSQHRPAVQRAMIADAPRRPPPTGWRRWPNGYGRPPRTIPLSPIHRSLS